MNLSSCIDLVFIILVYFSTVAIYVNSHGLPGLTFIQKNHALINIKGKIKLEETSIKYSIAVACPAENHEEKALNKNSLGGHSLFVKDTFNVPSDGTPLDLTKLPYERCQNSFKMSVCFQKSSDEFLFGYEVYYDRKIEGIKSNNYANFDYVENAYKLSFPFNKRSKPKLKLNETPLSFLWILSFRVIFDNTRLRPRQIIYTVSKTTEIGVSCKNRRLGKQFFLKNKNISLASLYENQKFIFEDVNVPKFINEPKKEACISENQCLTKESLIPAEEFRFRYPEPKKIACSNLTTVPIWESIAKDALRKIDRFLYALTKVVDRDLHLAAGVHGILELPKLGRFKKLKKIKLGKNGEVPVPNVIYKMVKYHVPVLDETSKLKNLPENSSDNPLEKPLDETSKRENPPEHSSDNLFDNPLKKPSDETSKSENPPEHLSDNLSDNPLENLPENPPENPKYTLLTRALIILIHNDPYFDTTNAVCGIENCVNWGWEHILYRGIPSIKENPSKYVFCCRADKETLKYLNMKVEEHETLNLKDIPVFDKKSKNIKMENIEQRVINEMDKFLFKDENDTDDDQDDEEFWNYDFNKETGDTEYQNDDFHHLDTKLSNDDSNDDIDDEKHPKNYSNSNVDESQVYYSSENDEQKAETTHEANNLFRSTTTLSYGNESDGDTTGSEKENDKGDTIGSQKENETR